MFYARTKHNGFHGFSVNIVSLLHPFCYYMRTNFSTQAKFGKAVERDGTRSGGGTNGPSGLYPCAPGGLNDYVWIMTSRGNPEHWSRLCKVMGREDLIDDPRFATPTLRVKNDAELDPIIRAWTQTRTKYEAMELVGGAGIPAGPVLDTMELQNDPSLEARGAMQTMQHPTHGGFKMPAWPVRVNGKPPGVKASPILGQHTADVLTEWLGMSPAEVEGLKGDGVL